MGHPYGVVETLAGLRGRSAVSHICQNQADVGHPAVVRGQNPKPVMVEDLRESFR